MDLQHLSIGQMAKLNHISEQTLRLYDKMNLLKPISVNQEIHERLNAMNLNTMPAILQSRYDYIKKEMEKMKINQAAILRSINSFNRYMTLPQIGKIFYEYIPERKICVYHTGANYFSYSYYEYEYHLRMFKDYLIKKNFPISYFSNVGTIIRHAHITEKEPDFFSDEIFVLVENEDHFPLEIETVPAGTYMSMCCSEFENEKTYALQLFEELQNTGYEILGDYLCEVFPNILIRKMDNEKYFIKYRYELNKGELF